MQRRHFLAASLAAGLALRSRIATANEARLRVAVVGHTGRGNFGHGLDTMWLSLPETQIVGVADPDPQGLAAALGRLGVESGFADYRTMFEQTRPDIVAIGMRHVDQHLEVALAALAAGVRGIYMEKPFCRTPHEADQIVDACQRHGAKLALAHRNRYHPVLPVVATLVADGHLGRLLEMRARGKEDARGGSLDLWVLGSHLLNLVHYFGGAPRACSAVVLVDGRPATRDDVRDGAEGVGPLAGNAVHARFDMDCGVPAFFDSIQNAGTAAAGFGLQLIGTQGIVDLRIDREPLAQLLAGNPFHPTPDPRAWVPISSAGVGKPEPRPEVPKQVMGHLTAARDLIAAMSEDREPLCSAESGRTTVEMIAAVFASHRLDGRRVALPLADRGNPLATLS
jgi:predicted dehydrogenase